MSERQGALIDALVARATPPPPAAPPPVFRGCGGGCSLASARRTKGRVSEPDAKALKAAALVLERLGKGGTADEVRKVYQ